MPASTATGKRRPTHDQDASRIPDREPSRAYGANPHRSTHASSHRSAKDDLRRRLAAGSAVVGAAAGKDPQDAYRSALVVADEQHPPVADAQPGLGSSGEAANVPDGIVGAEPVDRVENAVHHRRIEAAEVALRTRRELRPPDGVAHA